MTPKPAAAAAPKKKMSSKAVGPLAKSDQIILRLNKLLAAPGGLSTFLSTFNYTLYIITHLETQSAPLRARLLLGSNGAPTTPVVPAGPSSIAKLGALVAQARTTIRLLGLLPIYAWARQLAQGPKPGQDAVLYATAVTQCTLYGIYQFLENLCYLTDSGVISPSFLARWTKDGGKTAGVYLVAYRAWCLGIACDFVRLAREAQLERNKRGKRSAAEQKDIDNYNADKASDAKWWNDLIIPAAWFPMGYHFAQWNEGGFPGFNLGVMGLCGGVAGWAKFKMLWDSTADA